MIVSRALSIPPLPDLPCTLDGVRIEHLRTGKSPPLIACPARQGVDLVEWIMNNAEIIDTGLLTCGAVLFRGFGPASVESFRRFGETVIAEPMGYEFELTPRAVISGPIHRSTGLPPDIYLNIHNECCAQRNWPMRLALCCLSPAGRGGETPLADRRKVPDRLTPELRKKFARLGIMYFRNISKSELDGVFGADARRDIEKYCEWNDDEFEWDRRGGLHLRFITQAIAEHPVTAEAIWFNHACVYLVSSYPFISRPQPIPSPVAALPYEPGKHHLNACFGDGSPIDDESVFQIHNAFAKEAVEFPWRKDDILLLDNMLVAHRRNSFTGKREILLTMGNLHHTMQAA